MPTLKNKHSHSDNEIKIQNNLKEIKEASSKLDKLGNWNIPEKIKKGIEYTIWTHKQ